MYVNVVFCKRGYYNNIDELLTEFPLVKLHIINLINNQAPVSLS